MARVELGAGANSVLGMQVIAVDTKTRDSVVVNNLAGAPLNYFTNMTSPPAGTIAAAASQTFTTPVWIQSQGRTSVKITGGQYGAV